MCEIVKSLRWFVYVLFYCVCRLCVTKLDILDVLPEIKIGVAYRKNGKVLDYFPSSTVELAAVEVNSFAMT